MSSGDFNYVTLRNIVPAHSDGSFIQNGYILTVGPDAKQLWVNSLALQNLVTSTLVVNSTVRFPAGIYDNLWYSTAYGSTSILQTVTVGSTLSASTTYTNYGEFSTFVGAAMTASSISVSSLWFSTATGSSVVTSTLSASTIYFSTMGGSTLWTSTLAASTANLATVTAGLLTVSTLGVSSASVSLGYYSTLWGSTLIGSTAQLSTLGVSTMAVSTASVTYQTVSSLSASTSLMGSLGLGAGQFSTLAGSTATVSSIGVSSLGFSTAAGSTLWVSSATVSSLGVQNTTGSTIYGLSVAASTFSMNYGAYSTLIGSTFSASTAQISSLGASTIGVTTLTGLSLAASTIGMNAGQFSTLAGSTASVSSLSVSTLAFSTALGSSLWASSIFGSTLAYSTAIGSSLTTSAFTVTSTAAVSSLGVSTLAVSSLVGLNLGFNGGNWNSTLTGSTLGVTSLSFATMGGSTITTNTFMASTLALVSSGKLGVGLGAQQPTYNLQTGLYNTVNLSGNFIESWSQVSADMTAFTATYNGTLSGPAGSPSAMSVTIGPIALDAVVTYNGTLVPGNVYQMTFMAKCSAAGSFYLCNHMKADQIIPGTVSTALTTAYAAYTITFTAPSGLFGISFVSSIGATASWYGFQLQGFFTAVTGGLGIGTTGPAYGLHVPLGSIQAYNYQQFEWINTQSSNTLGWFPASGGGFFRVATMGSTTAGYGLVNLRGTVGDMYNPMYVDLSVLTRGGIKVFGTVEGTAAGATKCDLVYATNSAGGFDLYIYIVTSSFIVFDIQVSGASGSNILYDPATSAVIGVTAVTSPVSLTAMATSYTTTAGYLGIGKTNPNYAIDVAGSINVSGTVLVNGVPISLLSNPTGATGAAGKEGATGLSGGGTGPTGPPGGPVSVLSQKAAGTQILAPSTPTLILWPTVDTPQCTGFTGLLYSAGLFTNTTYVTIPVLVEYSMFLDATGYGSSYIAVNGAANSYAIMYNDVNAFTNSYTVLVPSGGTLGIYYTDNGTPTILSNSRVTLTLLTAGQQGPTGMSQMTTVATLSVLAAAGQTITGGAAPIPIVWGAIDALQTQNRTGLTYSLPTGLFVNNSPAALPLLMEYSVQLVATSGGASFVGITPSGGSLLPYGPSLNDHNEFRGSYTVLVPAGASVGIYYMDNQTTTVATTSQLTMTLLFSAWGPTGPMGTVARPSMQARVPSVVQAIPALTTTLVAWGSLDAGQTVGTVGLTYSAGGLFTNTTVDPLPLLVEYTIFLDITGQGTSSIGINGTSTVYGTMYNDNNCFTNSYTVLLPAGSTMGVYYYDNNAVNVQPLSRIMITLLTAGPQGPIGPTGQTGTSLWSTSGSIVSYSAGNVGIGADAPRQRLTVLQDGLCTANEYGTHSMAVVAAAQASGNMVLLVDADNVNSVCALQSFKDSYSAQSFVMQPRGGAFQLGSSVGTNTTAVVNTTGYKMVVEQGQAVDKNGIWVSNSNYPSVQGVHLSMVNAGQGSLYSYAVLDCTNAGRAPALAASLCLQSVGGNVGIGTTNPGYSLHVVGNIYATGSITQASDARLKTRVEPLMGALEYIRRLKGYWYERTDHEVGRRQIGFLAQEVRAVFPEAVRSDAERVTLDYGCLVAPVVESVKELDGSVQDVQRALVIAHRRIRELTEFSEEMEAEIHALKRRLLVVESAAEDHLRLRSEFEDLKAFLSRFVIAGGAAST